MTDEVESGAIAQSLAELERRSHRLRTVGLAVLFVLLLVSMLSLAFTIATAVRTANLIERASAIEAERGRELTEARQTVDEIQQALVRLERAAGIALSTAPPSTERPQPSPSPAPSASPKPHRPTPTPSRAPSPSPAPTPLCVLEFCIDP